MVDKERLENIKKRKKARTRNRIIVLSLIIILIIALISLIVSAIKGTVKMIKNSMPTPTPTPVAIVLPGGKPTEASTPHTSQNPEHYPVEAHKPIPPANENNNIINIIENSSSKEKICYLTFDDGPNKSVTPEILDILRRYNIKATFFQVGSLIEENIDVSKRVYEEGHLIGNHSYSHSYDKMYYDKASFLEEYNKCAELIKDIYKDDFFPVVRFPGGSHNSGKYAEIKQELKTILKDSGIYYCDWNALNGDAEGSAKSTEELLSRVKTTSKNQDKLVLLMHDASSKKQTVKALPAIIDYLISEGYTFARLDKPIL